MNDRLLYGLEAVEILIRFEEELKTTPTLSGIIKEKYSEELKDLNHEYSNTCVKLLDSDIVYSTHYGE